MPASASARFQASAQPSNLRMSRLLIGRKSDTCAVERNAIALLDLQRGLDVGQHQRRGAIGHQRAVGALERAGDERILLARRCGRTRSPDPCAIARKDCRRRSCGSSPRSWRARRTGRPSAGNKAPRSCRKSRRSRPRCRPPRAHRTLSTDFFRSPGPASWSSVRRRPPARRAPPCAAIDFSPWCTAAEPVAQAFSTRSARLKRSSGEACSTSEAVKSCAEKPALKWPSTISSTSLASMPASASAPLATRTIRLSTVSPSSLPKGVCAQPTMQPVMTASSCRNSVAFLCDLPRQRLVRP